MNPDFLVLDSIKQIYNGYQEAGLHVLDVRVNSPGAIRI